MMARKLLKALTLALAMILLVAQSAYAGGAEDQPVEWATGSNYRTTLTSVGQGWLVGWDKCDGNDYVMKINKYYSVDPDRLRIYSYDTTVANAFRYKSPMGRYLNGTSAHLCLGFRDTWNGGGPFNVASKLFVWVR